MDNSQQFIYLDNHSTTKVDSRVLDAMLPYLTDSYGNPSSDSELGLAAKVVVNNARGCVARLINSSPREIYFTSGATEALNWAIRGIIEKGPQEKHIITSTIEHSAVLRTIEHFEINFGVAVTRLQPKKDGIISVEDIKKAINKNTILVAIQHANNEIGTIQQIEQIGLVCRKADVAFLVDAAQSLGKIECDVKKLNIDLLAASGHKIYGPKGVGFLYVNDNVKERLNPILFGGGQENAFRSGTLNVPGIVGLGKACDICLHSMEEEVIRIKKLRDEFLEKFLQVVPDIVINGSIKSRLPGNINISIPGIPNRLLINNVSNLLISKGSACNSSKSNQSHVILSITDDNDIINSAIRIGIGRFNTKEEITIALNKIIQAIEEIKQSNAF